MVELVDQFSDTLAATDEVERVRWLTVALRARGVKPREMAYDPATPAPAPLRFRQAEPTDVEGALDRLRLAGRIGL